MEQLLPWTALCLAVLLLCLARPGAGRVFLGFFYLVMALGINVVLVFVAPDQFVALGTSAPLIPLYQWFFAEVVARSPVLFGLLAAAYEIAVGVLLLSRGRHVTWGIIGGIVHLIGITPLGVWTLANPIMALALAALWRGTHDRSVLDMTRSYVGARRHYGSASHPRGHR